MRDLAYIIKKDLIPKTPCVRTTLQSIYVLFYDK